MIHFERTLKIDATPDDVWAVCSNFMHIDEFAPEIVTTEALTDGEDGIGSRRRNHFKNGSSMVEEITEWEPAKRRYRTVDGYYGHGFSREIRPLRLDNGPDHDENDDGQDLRR